MRINRWMKYRGMVIICFIIYPFMFVFLGIILYIFERRILTFKKFNKGNIELWKNY